MSKWDFVLNKLGKAAPKLAKEEEMFPAIKALLKKEQGKEAEWAKSIMYDQGNPVFKIGKAEEPWVLKDVRTPKSLAQDDVDFLLKTNSGQGSSDDLIRAMYRGLDSHEVKTKFYGPNAKEVGVNKTGVMRKSIIDEALDAQPIFWADDVVKKKGIPKIEDALIREREREKLFNTNNPLNPERVYQDVATELRQLKDAPSGAPMFQSVNKWLEDSSGKFPKEMSDAVEQQLQGRRFFFPVKANIKETDPTIWLGEYLKGKPIVGTRNTAHSKFSKQADSYPWVNGPNVFFADGTEI
jgi:hypothetical protein